MVWSWSLILKWTTGVFFLFERLCSDAPPINLPLSVESLSIQGSNNKQGQFDYSLLSEESETSIFWVNLLIFSFSPLMYHYKNTTSAALQRFVVVLSGKQRRFFLKVMLKYWTSLPLELLPLSLLKQHGHDTQKNKSPSTNGALTGLDALS